MDDLISREALREKAVECGKLAKQDPRLLVVGLGYVIEAPAEAARRMGYEVIDEEMDKPGQAKADDGKTRPTLVPVSLINAVTAIREYGTAKYHDPDNWRQVEPQRYRDALYRHWLAYLGGEKNDQESGYPHLWHLACNVAFLIELEGRGGPTIC